MLGYISELLGHMAGSSKHLGGLWAHYAKHQCAGSAGLVSTIGTRRSNGWGSCSSEGSGYAKDMFAWVVISGYGVLFLMVRIWVWVRGRERRKGLR